MILHVALGLSVGVAEYAEIREAYRRLPRFSYVATTTGRDLQRPSVYRVNFIRGVGQRVEQRQGNFHTFFWTGEGARGYTWTQEDPPVGASDPIRLVDVRLKVHLDTPLHKPNLPRLGAGPQLDYIHTTYINWWEVALPIPERFSALKDIYIDGRPHRRLAILSENGQRTVLTYETERRRLREIRQEWRQGEGYELAFRTTYRYLDARKLTAMDVAHPGIVPAFPKMSVKPTARPERDRPVPVRGETVEDISAALEERYESLQTLRDTIEPVSKPGTPQRFHLSINLDREAGRRLLWRGPFETIAQVGPPVGFGRTWHVTAAKGYLNVTIGQEFFPHDALPLGAYLMLRAWDSPEELDLRREGYRVRSDRWKGRAMKVLWRPVVTGQPSIIGPLNPRTIGTEEVWIDSDNGLIVRSRRILDGEMGGNGSTYEVHHRPEPNAKLTASDLEFVPTKVDAVKLVERELKHGGGRASNEMRFEYWPQ